MRRELDAFLAAVESTTGQRVVLYVGDDFENAYPVRKALDRPLWHRRIFWRADLDGWWIWPPGLPVQIHGMDGDPFFAGEGDIDAARTLVAEARTTTRAELFTYPGDRHLFTDRSLASHDAPATELVVARVIEFLAALSSPPRTSAPPEVHRSR